MFRNPCRPYDVDGSSSHLPIVVCAGKDSTYQLKKKRSTLSFFKGKTWSGCSAGYPLSTPTSPLLIHLSMYIVCYSLQATTYTVPKIIWISSIKNRSQLEKLQWWCIQYRYVLLLCRTVNMRNCASKPDIYRCIAQPWQIRFYAEIQIWFGTVYSY